MWQPFIGARFRDLTIGWRHILPALALAALVAVFVYLAWGTHGSPSLRQSRLSQQGLYQVMIEPEGGRIKPGEAHPWLLTVRTAGGKPVEYAAIDISGGMPQHRHGLPSSPQATDYLGKGRYRIDGLQFTMDGWWQLHIGISAAPGTDSVVFNLVL